MAEARALQLATCNLQLQVDDLESSCVHRGFAWLQQQQSVAPWGNAFLRCEWQTDSANCAALPLASKNILLKPSVRFSLADRKKFRTFECCTALSYATCIARLQWAFGARSAAARRMCHDAHLQCSFALRCVRVASCKASELCTQVCIDCCVCATQA